MNRVGGLATAQIQFYKKITFLVDRDSIKKKSSRSNRILKKNKFMITTRSRSRKRIRNLENVRTTLAEEIEKTGRAQESKEGQKTIILHSKIKYRKNVKN